MKRKSTYTVIIVSFLIISVGVYSYQKFLKPFYLNNQNQTKSIDLKLNSNLSFGKTVKQKSIYGIEIEVTGKSNSIFDLSISNGKQTMHSASIKNGEIDFVYKNDWYSDSCFLLFQPRGDETGELEINCRFLAID